MYVSKIISFFASIIIALFNYFPGSDFVSELYAMTYDWGSVSKAVTQAVEEGDSQAIASMASPKMREKFPDMVERLDAMFAEIEGDIVDFESDNNYLNTEMDYSFLITTTERMYRVEILYTAVDAASKQTELGIRRVMLRMQTDEYYSWWADPDHYMAAEVIDSTDFTTTRRWCCGIGNSSDEYVFIIEEDYSVIAGYTNVSLRITRNNGYGIPASGYALHEGDELKIHFIPEGEEPPAPGTRIPDAVVKEEDHPNDWVYYVKPGRYYLYVEPSDAEMYYTVNVNTRL